MTRQDVLFIDKWWVVLKYWSSNFCLSHYYRITDQPRIRITCTQLYRLVYFILPRLCMLVIILACQFSTLALKLVSVFILSKRCVVARSGVLWLELASFCLARVHPRSKLQVLVVLKSDGVIKKRLNRSNCIGSWARFHHIGSNANACNCLACTLFVIAAISRGALGDRLRRGGNLCSMRLDALFLVRHHLRSLAQLLGSLWMSFSVLAPLHFAPEFEYTRSLRLLSLGLFLYHGPLFSHFLVDNLEHVVVVHWATNKGTADGIYIFRTALPVESDAPHGFVIFRVLSVLWGRVKVLFEKFLCLDWLLLL